MLDTIFSSGNTEIRKIQCIKCLLMPGRALGTELSTSCVSLTGCWGRGPSGTRLCAGLHAECKDRE